MTPGRLRSAKTVWRHERAKKNEHHASGEKWFSTVLKTVAFSIWLFPPYGGGSRIRTYNLLVTSVRLRGVKMAALREWREVVFQFSD